MPREASTSLGVEPSTGADEPKYSTPLMLRWMARWISDWMRSGMSDSDGWTVASHADPFSAADGGSLVRGGFGSDAMPAGPALVSPWVRYSNALISFS